MEGRMAMAGRTSQLALVVLFVVGLWSHAACAVSPLGKVDHFKVEEQAMALEQEDGSFGSLLETYQALRAVEIVKKAAPDAKNTCAFISQARASSSGDAASAFAAAKLAVMLNCIDKAKIIKEAEGDLLAAAKAKDLLSLYYSITALAYLKSKNIGTGAVKPSSFKGAFDSLQALAGADGWKYAVEDSETSAKASGFAMEAVAGLVSLGAVGASEAIGLKSTVAKLFNAAARKTEAGLVYFPARATDAANGDKGGSVGSTGAVVSGYLALAGATHDSLKVSAQKVVAAANYLLDAGISPVAVESFYQLEALLALNENDVVVPLIVTNQPCMRADDTAKVMVGVTTVLGGLPPLLKLKLVSASLGPKGKPFLSNVALEHLEGTPIYQTAFLSAEDVKLGKYFLTVEVDSNVPHYTTGGPVALTVKVAGVVKVEGLKLAVLDSEAGRPDSEALLTFGETEKAKLAATHLQKLALTFNLLGHSNALFVPQQVLVKLTHETGVQHFYVPKLTGDMYKLKLEFLELMNKLFYLSGPYSIDLIVGDSAIDNSFSWRLGEVELDLPDAPEDAPKPPAPPADLSARFAPKAEISHIFRLPEARPALSVSYAFTALALLPLLGLIAGLAALGVNLNGFPSAGLPLTAAVAFHAGLGAILFLYFAFWLQLNLFTTLQWLGILGLLTAVPGHYTLAYLADHSTKVKTA